MNLAPRRTFSCTVGCGFLVSILSGAPPAAAAIVDFESPFYVAGSLNGQDGWGDTGYATGGGEWNVVDVDAISGSMSASVTGASDFRDIYRNFFESFGEILDGDDIKLTVRQQMPGFGTAGLVLSNNGFAGESPLYVQINGTDLEVYTGFSGGVNQFDILAAGAYTIGNVLEWRITSDYATNIFSVSYRDVTLATDFSVPVMFDQVAGDNPLFDGGFPEIILAARSGDVVFDDIALIALPEPSSVALLAVSGMLLGLRRRHSDVSRGSR
jgi:hypothetical protein